LTIIKDGEMNVVFTFTEVSGDPDYGLVSRREIPTRNARTAQDVACIRVVNDVAAFKRKIYSMVAATQAGVSVDNRRNFGLEVRVTMSKMP
jgi:hypothetical protein